MPLSPCLGLKASCGARGGRTHAWSTLGSSCEVCVCVCPREGVRAASLRPGGAQALWSCGASAQCRALTASKGVLSL